MIAIVDPELKRMRMVDMLNTTIEDRNAKTMECEDATVLSAARALLSLSPPPEAPDGYKIPSTPSAPSAFKKLQSPPFLVNLPPSCLVSLSDNSSDASLDESHSEWSDHADYHSGSVSLALDEDKDSLSPLHCFMRRYCVEAFSAKEEDICVPRYGKSHGGKIEVGQVGIRCIHCKHRPPSQRQERAVCFPSSLHNIYHSIETWQRRHSLVCQDIPTWIRMSMAEMMQKSRSGAGGRRKYWEESAERLGMANTSHGIRFIRTPGDLREVDDDCSEPSLKHEEPSYPIVSPEDSELVTEYLFLLLDQMETCRFTEQDREGGRSKVKDCPAGYPGMQCKHCRGKAGFGRYFPTTLQALTSANSDRNIFNHISKCRRCPKEVRDELYRLRDDQQQGKNRRGSRKLFFEHVWERLHSETC